MLNAKPGRLATLRQRHMAVERRQKVEGKSYSGRSEAKRHLQKKSVKKTKGRIDSYRCCFLINVRL